MEQQRRGTRFGQEPQHPGELFAGNGIGDEPPVEAGHHRPGAAVPEQGALSGRIPLGQRRAQGRVNVEVHREHRQVMQGHAVGRPVRPGLADLVPTAQVDDPAQAQPGQPPEVLVGEPVEAVAAQRDAGPEHQPLGRAVAAEVAGVDRTEQTQAAGGREIGGSGRLIGHAAPPIGYSDGDMAQP